MGIFKKRSVKDLGEKKKDMPEGLWQKCPGCKEVVYEQKLAKNMNVCIDCGHHFSISSDLRLASILDENSFEEIFAEISTKNPLDFKGYEEKITKNREKTNLGEAVITGRGTIDGTPVVVGIMDFRFLAASMGSAVGEKITRAIETATQEKKPIILFSASGGARMHEGILSLMQMAKTCGALARHSEQNLPYISVITHPTTGGVTASFATVGDIILAEPGAMIGFAGPRVIKETTHQKLPPGFQTAEFMLDHGLVDMIVERQEMRATLDKLLGYLQPAAA